MGKTYNFLFKVLKVLIVLIVIVSIAVFVKNNNEKKQVQQALITVGHELQATHINGYSGNQDNDKGVIKAEMAVKDREEIFTQCKKALPNLRPQLEKLSNYYDALAIVAKLPDGDTQGLSMPIKQIGEIEWDKLNNFDEFLEYTNTMFTRSIKK